MFQTVFYHSKISFLFVSNRLSWVKFRFVSNTPTIDNAGWRESFRKEVSIALFNRSEQIPKKDLERRLPPPCTLRHPSSYVLSFTEIVTLVLVSSFITEGLNAGATLHTVYVEGLHLPNWAAKKKKQTV